MNFGEMKFFLLTAFLLLSSFPLHLQGASEEGKAEGGEESSSLPPCAVPHDTLNTIFKELFNEFENITVYVNCLSFDKTGSLKSGIISGINETGGGMRLLLRCVENVIASKPSSEPPVDVNMTRDACVSCMDDPSTNISLICNGSCSEVCERCYDAPTSCTRCTACNDNELDHCFIPPTTEESTTFVGIEKCGTECTATGKEVNIELHNFCECPKGYYRILPDYPPAEEEEEGALIPDECTVNPELEDFTCVKDCNANRPGFSPNEELHETCFACGLEYCLRCTVINVNTSNCDECLEHTILFEHECFACPLANIALVAVEQEAELQEEERLARLRQVELAISLPIVCVLVIMFFVGMSFLSHFRYPHISPAGHKRHRIKPEDFSQDIVSNDTESIGTTQGDVWRARPTVRLR